MLFLNFASIWIMMHKTPNNWLGSSTWSGKHIPCCWLDLPFENTTRSDFECKIVCGNEDTPCTYELVYFESSITY